MLPQRVFTVAVIAVVLCLSSVAALQAVPRYDVHLDKTHPKDRWVNATKMVLAAHGYENSFAPVIGFCQYAINQWAARVNNTVERLNKVIQTRYPTVWEELEGIKETLEVAGHNQSDSFTASLVYMYEMVDCEHPIHAVENKQSYFHEQGHAFHHMCTGILSLPQDNMSAPIIHGRNMDFEPRQGRNLTLDIRFHRNGTEVYRMFEWSWFFGGGATANRIGGVTMELNVKYDPALSMTTVMDRIENNKSTPVILLLREVMERSLDFDGAKVYLTSRLLGANCFIIMSGTQRRGGIFSLNFFPKKTRVTYVNDSSPVPFLVQTNYDHWKPDPTNDPRRTVAQNTLKMMGRINAGTKLGVWTALSTFPVHNPGTFFSLLQTIGDEEPYGFVRSQMVPDMH